MFSYGCFVCVLYDVRLISLFFRGCFVGVSWVFRACFVCFRKLSWGSMGVRRFSFVFRRVSLRKTQWTHPKSGGVCVKRLQGARRSFVGVSRVFRGLS